ncbi:NUDIX hydrolase [Thermocrispum municipale]|jgi:8-oxo-dGTP pyrophosphatase MutT (NUDIX family)|uniref:NUDIX hydrolase n=1 Tax=Thermocrispum municipale TaxID=37926 RepID=UPI00041F6B27|nr:CoA pyrophosphatase [Thermocrispum municipale]
MNRGALVDVHAVPPWLRKLVEVAGSTQARDITRFVPPPDEKTKAAAVLVLFGDGEAGRGHDVLLQRRAHHPNDRHSGQVAFPGGGAEDGDDGPVGTALREAEEETGLDPAGVLPIAVMPELWIPVSGFAVTPVLAYWQRPSRVWAVDPAETAAVARVPIADLADPANRFMVFREDTGWRGPAFSVHGMLVWGFTAGLLSALLSLAGWEREWNTEDVRPIEEALREHGERLWTGRGREGDG